MTCDLRQRHAGVRFEHRQSHTIRVSAVDGRLQPGRRHLGVRSDGGSEPDVKTVAEVREALDKTVPVLLNTGARAETIKEFFRFADGCIVGSSLKRDGYTWNEVDPERVKRFVDAARSA